MGFHEFYVPKFKYELVQILNGIYPEDNFTQKKKKQLYAIYFTYRKRIKNV